MQENIISKTLGFVDGYEENDIEIVYGLKFNAYKNFKTIEYYTSSQYLEGNRDDLGRRLPFYNVLNYRVNTAVKATDFDTKDIQLSSATGEYVRVMLLNKELKNWFKEVNFAKTINKMIYTRPKYGELMIKKIEKDGKLDIQVVDWRNVVIDPCDILGGTITEIHYMKPHKLLEKKGTWNYVEEALDGATSERKDALGSSSEASEEGIKIYETYGYFKDSDVTGSEDDTYKRFKVIMTDQYVLWYKEITELPYKTLAWEEVPGRIGRGVVEDGFEAQIWTNDAVVKERDIMEIASKVFWKTTDDSVEDNSLIGLDNGSIIHLQDGKDFVQVNAVPSSLPQINQIMQKWDEQYQRVSSSFDSVTGESMPSRTPFRTVAVLNEAGSSMFNLKREEFGIFMTEVIYDWVLPYLSKKINTAHILSSEFTADELRIIDESFGNSQANQFLKEAVIAGEVVSQEEYDTISGMAKELVRQTKNVRFLEIPKDYFKDLKVKVDIVTTGENVDKAAMFESLNNIFIAYAQNAQAVKSDPVLSKLFERIVDLSGVGISPAELNYEQSNTQTISGQSNSAGAEGLPPLPSQPTGAQQGV